MSVEVEVEERCELKREYPCLKKAAKNGQIVLFTAPGTGTLVAQGRTSLPVGDYDTTRCEFNFEPFYGKVTLSNKK